MTDEWVEIVKDKYWINKNGQVFNGSFIMKPWIHRRYYELTLLINDKKKHLPIHRLLAKAFIPNPDNKPYVDHINGNTLDNSLSNLRWATKSENGSNRKVTLSSSGYKAVTLTSSGRFNAKFTSNGKLYYLGTFDTAKEAHEAYCKKSREVNGDFHNPGDINCV